MKVQLSVGVSGLPDEEASYYASILLDGEQVGRTSEMTGNGIFSEMVVLEEETVTAEIQICSAADDEVVAQESFEVEAVVNNSYTKTVAKATEAGPNIALRATEETNRKFLLVLKGQNLPNTDFGIMFKTGNKTDPIFEMYNHLGKKICRSNKVEDDLNPVWNEMFFDLEVLCGMNLTAPLRITVYDKDGGDSAEYIGTVNMSVQQMLDGEAVGMARGGSPVGAATLSAQQAEILPDQHAPRTARAALEAALSALDNLEELKEQCATQQEEADAAQATADEAKQAAQEKEEAADALAAAQLEVQTQFAELATRATEMATQAESKEIMGTLKLSLAASGLADTDFGIRNKSDPIFEIYLGDDRLVRSNKVEDNLNPVWEEQTLDLEAVGNLDTPLKIVVSDRDGGTDDKNFLGAVEKSVNDLLAGGDPTTLNDQPNGAKGTLRVEGAELVDFVNVKEETNKLREECQALQGQLEEATQAFSAAQEEANEAMKVAADASVVAHEALEKAKAAMAAVEMVEAEG